MHVHHRRALVIGGAAILVDIACGLTWAAITPRLPAWHGLYCALADAVTRGGDCPLTSGYRYLLSAIECVTVVPLAAATWSLLTSGLASVQAGKSVRESEARLKAHIEARLRHLPGRGGGHRDDGPDPPEAVSP